ncbi:MAG: UdgX family uracil-DNA binding protein [Actinomycetota bacterium]
MARSAADHLPESHSLPELRDAAASCRGCDLYKHATQTVFGEGTRNAEVMLVGEQPGEREDIQGAPFVGPAGRLLDRALEAAGIDRKRVYVTYVVKHFKWTERGKRRIHKKPSMAEISACRPWLDAEIETVRPKLVVCLGATAAQAVIGRDFRVSRQRGEFVEKENMPLLSATVHPSSVLRAPDAESRNLEEKHFTEDLAQVARKLTEL